MRNDRIGNIVRRTISKRNFTLYAGNNVYAAVFLGALKLLL